MLDHLIATMDVSKDDKPTLLITRCVDDFKFEVVNEFRDNKALELYNELIGNREKCCKTCKNSARMSGHIVCVSKKHKGDYVPPYTVCDDWC